MSTANNTSLIPDPALNLVSAPLAAAPSTWTTVAAKGLTYPELRAPSRTPIEAIQKRLEGITDDLLASLPAAESLSAAERRGIIARYSAVLEGNFIYWMTGAFLATKSEEVHEIILENLHEEVRDCHPGMLRRFAMAAHSEPGSSDSLAVYPNLSRVRLFIGRLEAAPILTMMAFFEGYIQRFMPYLADLAKRQGSDEMEYTDVHGVCDVTHTQELFRALGTEMALSPDGPESPESLLEGVYHLEALLREIVEPQTIAKAQAAAGGADRSAAACQ